MAGKVKNLQFRDGRYYVRLVVPKELRAYVGKSELRTAVGADRREALRLHPLALAKLQDQIHQARQQAIVDGLNPHTAPRRYITNAEIAHQHYAEELNLDLRERDVDRATKLALSKWTPGRRAEVLTRIGDGIAGDEETAAVVGWAIEKFQARGSVNVGLYSDEWRKLASLLAKVELETIARSDERDGFHYIGQPNLAILREPPPNAPLAEPLPIELLFKRHIDEMRKNGRGEGTQRRWAPVFRNLQTFMQNDDARRISRTDVIKWREHLSASLAPKTIRSVYISAVRAVFQTGVDDGLLTANAAADIRVKIPRAVHSRQKGFTDDEAVALLTRAVNYRPPNASNPATKESKKMVAAKRWIVPLCAYSGARVAEIAQLRKEDIKSVNGISYLRITPDAGSVKGGRFREVPIHEHLIELGFLEFVNKASDEPLFFRPPEPEGRAQHPSKTVSQRLSKWIRSLGIIPEEVAPSHAWRHRFKAVAIELDLNHRVVDAIQDHAARTAGETYGNVTLATKARVIAQFPRILIDGTEQSPKPLLNPTQ